MAIADSKIPCSFEALTKNCQVFDPKGPTEIKLSDGSLMPNIPAIIEKEEPQKSDVEEYEEKLARGKNISTKLFTLQQELMNLAAEIPDSKMSPLFKFQLAREDVQKLLRDILVADPATVSTRLYISWPPSSNSTEANLVTAKEFYEQISNIFDASQLKRIKEIASAFVVAGQSENLKESFVQKARADVPASRVAEIKKIVESVQKKLEWEVTRGRADNELSPEELAAALHFRTVGFVSPNDELFKDECVGKIPDAFYAPNLHLFFVCPNLANFSDHVIRGIAAHEIKHASDPCSSQHALYEIDPKKLEELGTVAKPSPEINANDSRHALFHSLTSTLTRSKLTRVDPRNFADPTQVKFFEEKGVLKKIAAGIPFDKYVFKDVYDCLAKNTKAVFRKTEAKEVAKFAKEMTEQRLAMFGEKNYDPKADYDRIYSAYMTFPQCSSPGFGSQVRESMGDWASSVIEGSDLKGKTFSTLEDRNAPFAFFAGFSCNDVYEFKKEISKPRSLGGIAGRNYQDLRRQHDNHPFANKRIEEIFLAQPDIQKALDCKPLPSQVFCPHSIAKKPFKTRTEWGTR